MRAAPVSPPPRAAAPAPAGPHPASERLLAAGAVLVAASLPLSLSGANIGWVLLGAGALLEALRRRRLPAFPPGLLVGAFALYIGLGLLSGLLGPDPAAARAPLLKDLDKLGLLFVFAGSLAVRPSPKALRWLLAAAAAAAAIGILQSLGYHALGLSGGKAWYQATYRARGTMHPVLFGELLAFVLCGALAFLLRPDGRAGAPAWALRGFLLAGSTALLLSLTRGAWLALAGAWLLIVLRSPGRRLALALGAGAALAGASLLAAPGGQSEFQWWLQRRVQSLVRPGHDGADVGRVILWKAAADMARERPALGAGPGGFAREFDRRVPEGLEGDHAWSDAHNGYLQAAAERGLPGLAAFLVLLGGFVALAWKEERRRRDAWSLWALSAAFAFLIMNLTHGTFMNSKLALAFLFIWCWCRAVPPLPSFKG